MVALLWSLILLFPMTAMAEPVIDSRAVQAQSTRTAPLTIDEVLARIELTHPLLRATGVERMQAWAKILKALGAWEPTFKNTTQGVRCQNMINDEYAEFQKAKLAGPQAEITVAQKRQDLYLAVAVQYWERQVAVKQAEKSADGGWSLGSPRAGTRLSCQRGVVPCLNRSTLSFKRCVR